MNSLSWFIYAADASGSVSAILFMAGVVMLLSLIIRMGINADRRNWRSLGVKSTPDDFEIKPGRTCAIAFTLILVAALMPSPKTLHLIAASELGEKVIADEKTREVLNEAREAILRGLKSTGPAK